jgi:hypothetical protein
MTGEFIDQLTDIGNPSILLGSVMHSVGLATGVVGGIGMLRERSTPVSVER